MSLSSCSSVETAQDLQHKRPRGMKTIGQPFLHDTERDNGQTLESYALERDDIIKDESHRKLTETSLGCKPHFQLMCLVKLDRSQPYVEPHTHLTKSGRRGGKELFKTHITVKNLFF